MDSPAQQALCTAGCNLSGAGAEHLTDAGNCDEPKSMSTTLMKPRVSPMDRARRTVLMGRACDQNRQSHALGLRIVEPDSPNFFGIDVQSIRGSVDRGSARASGEIVAHHRK